MKIILLYISVLLLASCNSGTDDKRLISAIDNLATSYPALNTNKDSLTNILFVDYKSVKMKFNVFRSGHSDNGLYVLTVEYGNKISAIPIMPLNDSCYWDYENKGKQCDGAKNNFKFAYDKLLSELNLDTTRLGITPYHFIIHNVLYWETFRLSDTSQFRSPCRLLNLADVDSTALSRKRKLNVEQIIKLIHPQDYFYNYSATKDGDGNAVFWGTMKRTSKKDKWHFEFKSWSFKCPDIPIMTM